MLVVCPFYHLLSESNQIKARESGAIEIILSTLRKHMNNADVCERGCGALMNIALNNGKNIPD